MADSEAIVTTNVISDDMLIILPVRNLVLFPGVVLPVNLSREMTVAGAQEAARTGRKVGFLLQHDADEDNPGADDLHRVGTVANVLRFVTAPDGSHHLVVQGEQRFKVLDFQPGLPFLLARVEYLVEPSNISSDIEARTLHLKRLAAEAIT
jgi:ATP-dependent Lon protease